MARQFEDGTHRLIWNQSVTRTRWLAAKLALLGLTSLIVTGGLSLLLTWSASRYDLVKGARFSAAYFDTRNVVPLGYALFAFVLGTLVGLIVRRLLMAMAVTLVVFAAVQIVIPSALRAHYLPPSTSSVALSADVLTDSAFTISTKSVSLFNYSAPGAWSLTSKSEVVDANGKAVAGKAVSACISPGDDGPQVDDKCLSKLSLHFDYTSRRLTATGRSSGSSCPDSPSSVPCWPGWASGGSATGRADAVRHPRDDDAAGCSIACDRAPGRGGFTPTASAIPAG
ncbi:hypothetical protein [Streptomyces brasiliensis]|uniref:Uncharacterized protein n=1 Tax=Streptomyces brasiliensis TaxID=1954 RepID=A0A917PDR8_9ACTN|nr:hypothetical protein [Streptomyces brasiliensis]GGJ72044.1 hypothetical protein GCM10010121_098230 [Streptomyces brasiliensis]